MSGRWRRGDWLDAEVDLRNTSRPSVYAFWYEERRWVLGVRWGQPGCDPAWRVDLTVRVRPLLDRLLAKVAS